MSERAPYFTPELAERDPQYDQLIETSRHEMGHVIVAQSCGWNVEKVSVEAKGNVLGFTLLKAPDKDIDQLLVESAAISLGGQIAALMMGDHADGCSYDLSKAEALGQIAAQRGISMGVFWGRAHQIAKQALSSAGISSIEKRAQHLASRNN